MRFLNWGFSTISKVCVLSLLGTASACSSLLYYPDNTSYVKREKVPSAVEDIWIPVGPAAEGEKIHGWYFHSKKTKSPRAVIVFFHGNGENLTSHFQALYWLVDHEFDFMVFDYRGYGESSGTPSPENTVEDGKAVLRFMKQKASGSRLVVFGQSLGGAVALRVAGELRGEIPMSMVAVDSTFHSYQAVAKKVLASNFLTWLLQPFATLALSDEFAPEHFIANISPVPLLVIHGTEDETVAFELGQKVFELGKEPKEFWAVPGGTHIDAFIRKEGGYRARFLEKLRSLP